MLITEVEGGKIDQSYLKKNSILYDLYNIHCGNLCLAKAKSLCNI